MNEIHGQDHISLNFWDVSKTIGSASILTDLTIKVPHKRIVGFLGPNGAGKTTALLIAAGLNRPTSGRVWVDGIDMQSQWKEAKARVAFIAEHPLLYEELTGKEFLRFHCDLFGLHLAKHDISEKSEQFQLTNELDKYIKHYSLGNKKKLALLACLLRKPKLLLLDEYISGLDPISSLNIRSILTDYAANQGSVLLSTHQLEVAEKFCDEFILIEKGCIVDATSRKDVLASNKSLEDYFIHQIHRTRSNQGDNRPHENFD